MSGKTFVVRRGQTAVPNQTIYGTFLALAGEDGLPRQLSIQALGVLVLALSRPDSASMGYRSFQGRGMGRDALLKANRELGAAGLRFQFKRRSPAGSVITDTVISESPMTEAEAEAEWLERIRTVNGGIPAPVDNPGSDRAPENGATGPAKGSTVRRFTGARSPGASLSRESDNSLSSTSYLEREENTNAGADEGQHSQPGDPANGAAPKPGVDLDGPARRALREALEESKRAKLRALGSASRDQQEVAPLRPMTEAGPDVGTLAHQGGGRP